MPERPTLPSTRGGLFAGVVLSMMPDPAERERRMDARLRAGHQNRTALVVDFNTPTHTEGCMRRDTRSGRQKRGYKPGYNADSLYVGTIASEANSLDSFIFWTEMQKAQKEAQASEASAGHSS